MVQSGTLDFRYVDHGTIILFTPVTPRAKAWAADDDTMQSLCTHGTGYGVPHREFANVVDLIDDAGLYFAPGA